jgi:hypothetical protein
MSIKIQVRYACDYHRGALPYTVARSLNAISTRAFRFNARAEVLVLCEGVLLTVNGILVDY